MNEDLISNNFIESIDKTIIRRIIIMMQIAMTLLSAYSVTVLIEWYNLLDKYKLANTTTLELYTYRVRPLLALLFLLVSIISVIISIKINKLYLSGFENENAILINNANRLQYKLTILAVISYSILLSSLAIYQFLKN